MFDILKFIDSKTVREYNKTTDFTPLEKATIIYWSHFTTIDEKLSALHELLDTYQDEDFSYTSIGKREFGNDRIGSIRTNRQIIAGYVESCEAALRRRFDNENAVFSVSIEEVEQKRKTEECFFSTYDQAWNYLVNSKSEYQDCRITASIIRKPLDSDESQYHDEYRFDTDLNMYDAFGYEEESGDWGMESFFIYVPLPFQRGDIVRVVGQHEPMYGVVGSRLDKSYFQYGVSGNGDSSDMNVFLDNYRETNGHWEFDFMDSIFPLTIEKCKDEDLPKNQTMLTFLRDAYLDPKNIRTLLFLYTSLRNHDHQADDIIQERYNQIHNVR